jgi:uncharacterized protein (DUF1501 family)
MTSRRAFLRLTGLGLALPFFDVVAAESATATDGRLIVIFLRGGLDGLFAVAPTADPRLAEVRPSLSRTVLSDGIRLGDTGFSAHPVFKPVADLFAAGELAFSPSAGTTDKSRSHFQAQDLFELGTGAIRGSSGFMARAADALGSGRGAISFTRQVPLAFEGGEAMPQVAPLTGSGLRLPTGRLLEAIRAAHRGQKTGEALDQAIATESEVESAVGMEVAAARGAAGAGAFRQVATSMGRILADNPRLSLAFLDLGGFDTHANEDAILTRGLRDLGDGLAALKEALGGNEWRRTRLVVMSEFGRTVHENGTRGTDHGHGGLMLLAGGGVRGGRMVGAFGGLDARYLDQDRDLPAPLDWRAVLAACMREAYGWRDGVLDGVFPGRPKQRFDV